MNKQEVLYIGHYDVPKNGNSRRHVFPSAVNKMDYVREAIASLGHEVCVLSVARSSLKKAGRGEKIRLDDNSSVIILPAMGRKGHFVSAVEKVLHQIVLFFALLFRPADKGPVLVYHSLSNGLAIRLSHNIRKYSLILEVEEVYSDVLPTERFRSFEKKMFSEADAYLFPTETLNEAINESGKPFLIAYGSYALNSNYRREEFADTPDNAIHVVYAGTLDPRKGGALTAVAAAKFLPQRYHVHILGFGSDSDKRELSRAIEEAFKGRGARVTYDGILAGEEYARFMQRCDIGLSTQRSDTSFNATSFPSKVLSYLSSGLRVVSVRLEVLERSAISDLIEYYDGDDPAAVAQAIERIEFSDQCNGRDRIAELDAQFKRGLEGLLKEIE